MACNSEGGDGSPLVRVFDRKAKGYLKAFQRSFSSSTLDRNSMLAEEDPSAMTINFLQARLRLHCADYRTEKQRAQVLAKKVLELEHKLNIAVRLRKKAECRNTDASPKHAKESIGTDDSLTSREIVDETSEEHEEQGSGDSSLRQLSSSCAGDSDASIDDAYTDGDTESHFKVSSWQSCSYCGGLCRSENNREKKLCQSPKHLCHGHPPRGYHKNYDNALSTEKNFSTRKSMQRCAHRKMRRRQVQQANYQDYRAAHYEQHESDIDEVQIEKQGIVVQEAEKALHPCEGKVARQNPSTSLQFQTKNLSSFSMGCKEGLLQNTTFGARMHVEGCANSSQYPLYLMCLSNNATVNEAESYKDQCSRQDISDKESTLLQQSLLKAEPIRRHDGYMQQLHSYYGVSPMTMRVKSGFSSPLHGAAVPSQSSALQGCLDQCVSHATQSTDHLIISIDGGYNAVKEMLTVPVVTKQQIQIAEKQLKLPNEGGQHAAAPQVALVRTGQYLMKTPATFDHIPDSRSQLPERCQSPSRFFVETGAPNNSHFNSPW